MERQEEVCGMKKILVPLLVLVLLCVSLAALAEGNEEITVELNTTRLPVYEANDPGVDLFRAEGAEENTLPVLLVPLKKNLELRVTVMPKDLKNRKSILTTDDEEVARITENIVTRYQADYNLDIQSQMDEAQDSAGKSSGDEAAAESMEGEFNDLLSNAIRREESRGGY